jgi:small GTP-binding protein
MYNNTYSYKIVLLGETSVGKSSLVERFVNGDYSDFKEPTIGAAFLTKTFNINNKNIKYKIWDTAGQERYQALAPMYYRGAKAALIVFDITNLKSFTTACDWVTKLKLEKNIIIVLVANKCDLERIVSNEEATTYANENDILYFESSAKNNINIDIIFTTIAEKLPYNNSNIETLTFIETNKIKSSNCCYYL